MLRRGDERGVTVQIGAVLLLAIVFSAFALYQINAVPAENERVEFAHNQETHDELQDLRNAIQNVGTGGGTQSTAVTLGTQYPSRTFATNPPAPTGRLETTGTATVDIDAAFAGNESDYEGKPDNLVGEHDTTTLAYVPDYREYGSAPTTRIEHGFAFNDFGDAQVSLTDQALLSDGTIRLVTLEGELSRSGGGAVTLDPTALSGPSDAVPIEPAGGNSHVTISIPTAAPTAWNETIGTTFGDGESGARVAGYDDDRSLLTIELDDTYDELQVARVGIGSGGESSSEYDVTERDNDGSDSGGAYDVYWTGDHENVRACDADDECDYRIYAGETATFAADAAAQSAGFDFAYRTHDPAVTVFDEDDRTVDFEADGSGSVDLFVSSGGSSDAITVDVEQRSGLVVTDVDPQDPVDTGEDLDVQITVENRRDEAVTRTVTLDVDSERNGDFRAVASSEETVAAGASETITLTYATRNGDDPEVDVRGRTDDDENGIVRTAEVLDGVFDVRIVGTNDPVVEGETLEVTTEVRQTVGADVSLEVDGEVVDATSVGSDGEVTFTWATEPGDAGERTITVIAEGWFSTATDERTVTVTEPAFEAATATITDESGGGQAGVSEVTFEYRILDGADVEFTVYDETGTPVSDTVSATSDGTRTQVAVSVNDGSTSPGREPRPIDVEARVVGGETCRVTVDSNDGDGPFELCG